MRWKTIIDRLWRPRAILLIEVLCMSSVLTRCSDPAQDSAPYRTRPNQPGITPNTTTDKSHPANPQLPFDQDMDSQLPDDELADASGSKNTGTATKDQIRAAVHEDCGREATNDFFGQFRIEGRYTTSVGSIPYGLSVKATMLAKVNSQRGSLEFNAQNIGDVWPAILKTFAAERVAYGNGERSFSFFNLGKQRSHLASRNSLWSGIRCAVLPAYQQIVPRGHRSVTVQYEPALPMIIAPMASASTLEKELGDRRPFHLRATVVDSNYADAPVNSTAEGDITIARETAIPSDIQADLAYLVTAHFPSIGIDKLVNFGLLPRVTFYINTTSRIFTAIKLDFVIDAENVKQDILLKGEKIK